MKLRVVRSRDSARGPARLPTSLGYEVFETELGWVALVWSRRGVVACSFPRRSPDEALAELGPLADGAAYRPSQQRTTRRRLEQFFAGVPVSFDDLRIDPRGATPLFAAAWEACRTIPPGETRTYGWLAVAAGRPGAARAAGSAMARCPLSPIVPCHRVLGTSGVPRGYGSDPVVARHLRRMEAKLAENMGR